MKDGALYDVLFYSADRDFAEAIVESAPETFLFRVVDAPRLLDQALQNFAPDLVLYHALGSADTDTICDRVQDRLVPNTILIGERAMVQHPDVSRRLLESGLTSFIPLPMDPLELLGRIENFFVRRPKPPSSQKFKRLFRAGEPIFLENEVGHECFAIVSGRVRICRVIDSHTMQELDQLGPGEVFGELALLGSKRRTGTALAMDDVIVTVTTRDSFDHVVENEPEFMVTLIRVMARRIRNTRARLPHGGASKTERTDPPARGVAAGANRRQFRAGETIYEPGDAAPSFYLVETGRVERQHHAARFGSPVSSSHSGPGDLLGEVAYLLEDSQGHLAKALEDTTCLVLTHESLEAAHVKYPALYLRMAQGLATEQESLLERISGLQMHEVF